MCWMIPPQGSAFTAFLRGYVLGFGRHRVLLLVAAGLQTGAGAGGSVAEEGS